MSKSQNTNLVRARIISLAFGLLLIAGAAYLLLKGSPQPTSDTPDITGIMAQNPLESQGKANELSSQEPAEAVEDTSRIFTHPAYGFSFERPEGFTISSFQEGNGEMILAQGPAGQNSLQIFISPLDEEGPITAARIKTDLPKMLVESPQQVEIGGVKALVFFSNKAPSDKTREVWFIWPESPLPHGNYLYQVSSPAEFDAELSQIMATWTFQ